MIASFVRASVLAFSIGGLACTAAGATTAYDGSWSLSINTERGACDPSYQFAVQINNGYVSSPGLNKFRGRVTPRGAVRVSVSAGGKYASGSGRLSRSAGVGRWVGHSGSDRCSGSWSAQRY